MALILAIDPDGTQTPALQHLARELAGHELLSADSCAAAVSFVQQRVPDLVLVPLLLPDSEQAELQAQLRGISGGVPTLTIPLLALDGSAAESAAPSSPTEPCAPAVFADQIRQYLGAAGTGPAAADAAPAAPDPNAERRAHLLAAATAAINWARRRRTLWADAAATRPAAPAWAPEPAWAPASQTAPGQSTPAGASPVPVPPAYAAPAWTEPEAAQPPGPTGPSLGSRAAGAARSTKEAIVRWLPRVALIALAIGAVAAGRAYWPSVRAMLTTGTLVLESVPPGSEVFVDGTSLGTAPLTADLPAGPHTVEFRNGDDTETVEVEVVARDRVIERLDWTAEPSGSLTIRSDPSGARVRVDGEERGQTPITLDGLTAGEHSVVLESDSGTVRRRVTVVADQTVTMSELIFSGWVQVLAPFEVEISEDGQSLQQDDRGQILLSPGSHDLRVRNATLGYEEVRTVEIRPATATRLSIVPDPTSITVTSNEPADVFIDGRRVGSTPLTTPIALGTREVVVRTAQGAEKRAFVTATVSGVQHHVEFP